MKKTIEELAWEYVASIAGTDPNTDISLFENDYNAFIAGANAVKNNVDLADVGGNEVELCENCEKRPVEYCICEDCLHNPNFHSA